ncbi:chromate transporter [Parabacteroides sp. OttesenSCG-928-O15]|nr:chromate transporter [Parabacteroides sp. OttesenSCG-928-O15]
MFTLFLSFAKIGLFTIGGGYAMLPLIEREVVRRGWITQEEFIDLFSVAQSLPGVFAVNISIFVGYKIRRLPGAMVCALGTILPSFLIILLIALFFTRVADNEIVERVFKGIRPAVVALIAVPVITTARTLRLKGWVLLIPVITALLIWLAGFSPVWIILAAILGGLGYTFLIGEKIKKH